MQARSEPRGDLRDRQRQSDDEGRAFPFAGTLRVDAAPVQLDQVLDERQPQAEAAVRPRARAIRLRETLEDEGKHVGSDARSCVADDYLDVRVDALQVNLNSSALRGELHGVHQEVPYDLLKAARVSRDGRRSRVEHALQSNGLGLGRGPDRIKGSLDDGREIDRANVETHLARDNPRDIEEVVDELHLRVGVPHDRVERPLRLLVADLPGLQQPRPAVDRVEGRP